MSFTDMMSSGRGPGVIGMVMALFVLLGFGALFIFATDEGAQGGDLSIEALIARQDKDLESLKHHLESSTERLAEAPELMRRAQDLATVERENQRREAELAGLATDVESANEAIARLDDEFEAYKDEYRAFARSGAKGEKLEQITTTDGTVYRDVTIREVTAVGMQIRHEEGYKRIPFEVLPEDLQDRFQFDADQKEEAIALEQKTRLEHEKAVAQSEEEMAKLGQEQREEKERLTAVANRRRAVQLRDAIRAMERDIKQLSEDIALESQKKLSRAPQMRAKQASMRKKLGEMRSELAGLRSEM